MEGADAGALAMEGALDVHEAGVVAGGAGVGAGVEDGDGSFSASMAVETSAFLTAKVPPKPQHCSRSGSSNEVDAADGLRTRTGGRRRAMERLRRPWQLAW